MNKNYILNLTPTGMIPTRQMTPHVPITPEEIVAQVLDAAELGVNMVHLHARDVRTGAPTYKKDVYAKIISGIRERKPELILCVSTSGRTFPEFEKRSEVLELHGDLKPDFASLTLSSLNFAQQASSNSPQMIQDLARKMLDNGIRPELEAFDLGMINYAYYLIKHCLIEPPFYFNIILGNIASAQADPLALGCMLKELPECSIWSVGGIGPSQLRMNLMGLAVGGGVRVGLEDNLWFDNERETLTTNRMLIERIVHIGKALDCEPYSPVEARRLLGV